MTGKILLILKIMVLIFTIVLALIAILYVLDFFSGEYLRRLILKLMAVIGILTGVSLVTILLTPDKEK